MMKKADVLFKKILAIFLLMSLTMIQCLYVMTGIVTAVYEDLDSQNTNIEKRTLSVLGIKSFFFYFVSMQLSLQAHCLILSLPSTICYFTRAVRWSPSTSIRIVSPSLTSSARISFADSVSTCFCKKRLSGLAP